MPQQPSPDLPADANLEAKLQSIAQLLRQADHLSPEAQKALAEIVEELGESPVRLPRVAAPARRH